MNLWLVGQRSELTGETADWAVNGIYSTEEKAVAACVDWTYFVMGPITVDVPAPGHPVYCEKAYYPRQAEIPAGVSTPDHPVPPVGPAPWSASQ